jgi:hypothetical protein
MHLMYTMSTCYEVPLHHFYNLQYRYDAGCRATRLFRTGPSEGVLLGNPVCNTRVPCTPSKNSEFKTSFTIGWPWCHFIGTPTYFWHVVGITQPTGLSRIPLKFPLSKARPRLQSVASRTQEPTQYLRQTTIQKYKSNKFSMYFNYNFLLRKVLPKANPNLSPSFAYKPDWWLKVQFMSIPGSLSGIELRTGCHIPHIILLHLITLKWIFQEDRADRVIYCRNAFY